MHLLFWLSCRKNWTSTWTVLQGFSLLFAKGQGSGTSWVCIHAWLQWSLHLGQMWNYSLNPVSQPYFNWHALHRIPHSLPQICLHIIQECIMQTASHSVLGNKCKQIEAYKLLSKNCSIQIINILALLPICTSLLHLYLPCVFASVISCIITPLSVLFLSSISSLSLQSRTAAMVPFLNSSFTLLSNWKRSIKPRLQCPIRSIDAAGLPLYVSASLDRKELLPSMLIQEQFCLD